jgi:putative acetyltransferase
MIRVAGIDDLKIVRSIFERSISGLTRNDYTQEQREAWMASALDTERWKKKLANDRWWLYEREHVAVAMISLRDVGYIDMLYTLPEESGSGAATELMRHVLGICQKEGIEEVTSDVSHTARPFFEKFGFKAIQENQLNVRGVEMSNWRMWRGQSS